MKVIKSVGIDMNVLMEFNKKYPFINFSKFVQKKMEDPSWCGDQSEVQVLYLERVFNVPEAQIQQQLNPVQQRLEVPAV